MDVHDGLGTDGAHTMWEPPGYDESGAGAEHTSGYDGYDDSTGHDAAGDYDDSTGSSDSTSADTTDAAGTDSGSGGTEGSSTMTVEVDGHPQRLPAEKDYTGDGQADAAVETADGHVIVFSDTENNETGAAGPDGKADEAWIVDKATGKVVGAAHVDPRTGEWVDGADTDGPSSVPAGSGSEASS